MIENIHLYLLSLTIGTYKDLYILHINYNSNEK